MKDHNNVISAADLATEAGERQRRAAIAEHLQAIKELMEKPESVQGFAFAFSTDKQMTCALFGSMDEIKECIVEIVQKATELRTELRKGQ